MSHSRTHIIVEALIATGQFEPLEEAALKEIGEKPANPCSGKDALTVANIVRKKLRQPSPE